MSELIALQQQINAMQRELDRLHAVEALSLRNPAYAGTLKQAFTAGTWYTLIPSNTLVVSPECVYVIELGLTAGAEPWRMGAATLIRPINTNNAGAFDTGVALLTSTHTANYGGTPSQFELRYKTFAGAIAPEVQIRITGATGAPVGSTLTVKAYRMIN